MKKTLRSKSKIIIYLLKRKSNNVKKIKIDESELRSRAIIVKIFLRIRFLKQRNIFHAARSGAPLQQLRRDLIRTVQVFKGPRGRSIAGNKRLNYLRHVGVHKILSESSGCKQKVIFNRCRYPTCADPHHCGAIYRCDYKCRWRFICDVPSTDGFAQAPVKP